MLALLTIDLQNQTVTLLDIVVTPQGGFELNIIGPCPPILSVLHSVFIPTIIPRMIGLSPGTHLQMTSPFECIIRMGLITTPPSPPFLPPSPGSRDISVVVGDMGAVSGAAVGDMGAVSGAAAVGTLVMLLLLLLIFQRWRRHRKAMLKEPHLEQGLRAHHTELMALNGNRASETRACDAATTTARAQAFVHACAVTKLPMEIVQAKLVLAMPPQQQHELKPSCTHALPRRPRNPATDRGVDVAAMAELPFMGVPVSVGTQKRRQERSVSVETQTTFCGRERSVSVGTQTICEQECSVLSEVFEDTENPEQDTASAGGDLGRGEPRASDAHVERAFARGSAPGSASSSAQGSAHCSSSSTRDSGSGTRKVTGEATVAAPASGWEAGQELPRAQYDLRPKTADHLNVLPHSSYTDMPRGRRNPQLHHEDMTLDDFGAGVVERASAPMNVGRVLDGLLAPSYTDFGAGVVERASAPMNVGRVLDGLTVPSYTDFGAGVVERASALMNVGRVLDGLLAPSGASCQASRSGCAPQASPHARAGRRAGTPPSNFESRQQSTAGGSRRSENANLFETTFETCETHRNDSHVFHTVPDYENVEIKERLSRPARSQTRNAWFAD